VKPRDKRKSFNNLKNKAELCFAPYNARQNFQDLARAVGVGARGIHKDHVVDRGLEESLGNIELTDVPSHFNSVDVKDADGLRADGRGIGNIVGSGALAGTVQNQPNPMFSRKC